MAAKPSVSAPAAAARQHGSETTTLDVPSSSAGSSSPPELAKEPPRRPVTRKRAASINTEEANRSKIANLSLTTPNTASPRPLEASGGTICLCTPAPKVPRPRNAFILYRQHHQAQVVQQNPGLANPDISKIIGEQWRDEPEDRKNQWKLLAEEEKQRHQRQYPDYRYQPRRGNKSGSSQPPRPPLAPGEDPTRCSKCGGRYIATPRTPSTPFVTPTGSKPGLSLYGPPSGHHTLTSSRSDMSRHSRPQPYPHWTGSQSAPSSYDLHQEYERAISPNESKRRRHNPHGSYHNFHALPSPPTPFAQPAHQQHHLASSHSQSRQSPFHNNNPTTPSNYPPGPLSAQPAVARRTSPGPMMPPPPRPTHSMPIASSGSAPSVPQQQQHHQHQQQQQYQPQSHTRHADFDESLRLPPLQTHLTTTTPENNHNESHPNTGTSTNTGTLTAAAAVLHPTPASVPSSYYHGPAAAKRERDAAEQRAHARSIEAMVMSIPFVNKLRVLERISPPLGPVPLSEGMYGSGGGGGGGVNAKRGPVIAVEGPDARLVRAVAVVVERALRAAAAAEGGRAGWEVKCWGEDAQPAGVMVPSRRQPQRGSVGGGEEKDVVMGESGASHTTIAAPAANANTNHFTAYLRTTGDWHAKSAEIVDFITNPSTSSSSSSAPARETRLSTSSAATVNTTASSSSSSATNSATTDPNKTEPEPDSDSTPRPSKAMSTTQQRHPLPSGSSPKNKNTNINNTNANNTNTTTSNTTTPTAPPTTPRFPIAFLPSGFSLTLADRFACTVPIADAYAPVDHWQWMATLWRGVVGADLVIYVPWDFSLASLPSSSSASSSGASPFTAAAAAAGSFVGGGGGGVGGSVGGMGEDGGAGGVVVGPWSVEVRNSKLMVVMAPSVAFGSGPGYGQRDVEIAVDEKTERRLGFEVVEWVRGGGWLNAGRGLDGGMVMEY
ncbi:hypothetical protein F5144DRAFT_607270 [Chaetomium tenue]|uniref:Uncharacterized protein n=1 Tax=Chaetomium tenue TaxID=1854479 RepID=A0ACB7NTW5_9PEZI|nr:hypothetical protein F5144DRAFT_607270 [Chaetomium globosum]